MHRAARLLCIICLCLRAPADAVSSWSVEVPGSIPGLLGSCVVIPCSFDYPPSGPTNSSDFTGVWMDTADHVLYHHSSSMVAGKYQGRARLLGALDRKDCTLEIHPVRQGDEGPFFFRIEINNYNSYSFREKMVSVAVKVAPEPITFEVDKDLKVDDIASASCSVVHTCPTAPPTFTWSHSGLQTSKPHQREDGRWQAESLLDFPLTRDLHNKTLGCTVKYRDRESSSSSQVLLVKYPPRSVMVQHPPGVPEGEALELRCVSDGYPAPDRYLWTGEGGALLHRGELYQLHNVSRHSGRFRCRATNSQGHAESGPVRINATYPPEISQTSGCSSLRLSCVCVVDSNPPAAVRLSLADGLLLSSVVETQGSVTTATLARGGAALWSSDHVYCQASNNLGNITHTLEVPSNGKVLMFTGMTAGVLLLTVLLAFGIRRKRKKGKQIAEKNTLAPSDTQKMQNIYRNTKERHTMVDDQLYANM